MRCGRFSKPSFHAAAGQIGAYGWLGGCRLSWGNALEDGLAVEGRKWSLGFEDLGDGGGVAAHDLCYRRFVKGTASSKINAH